METPFPSESSTSSLLQDAPLQPHEPTLVLFLAPFTVVWAFAAPTVQLDQATVYGATNGSVTSYFNIPFAEPPVGDLRLRLPKPIANYSGMINATQAGPQCVQQMLPLRSDTPEEMVRDVLAALGRGVAPDDPSPESEDCLNLNVLVPAGTTPGAKLPVVAFISGGGFNFASNTQFQGEVMVERSIEIGQRIIFAAINYRLNAFGFLGGQEVKDAGIGNIGLYDEREGLRWINKHISAFGGDPNQVTIWGPSAGGFSVGAQMVTNGGDSEGLFRAAVLSCGSLLPIGDIASQQPSFDSMAEQVGCAAAEDKLQCLRGVPVDNFTAAATSVTGFFGEGAVPPWFPRADGKFLVEPVRDAVLAGRIADVPFIAGDSLDEGTIFATGAWNITTDDEFLDYARDFFFPGASSEEVAPLLALYPNDPAQGSPFGTGDADQLAPMYKRVAAFEGDFLFQSTRRSLLTLRADKQPAWTYIVLSKSRQARLTGLCVCDRPATRQRRRVVRPGRSVHGPLHPVRGDARPERWRSGLGLGLERDVDDSVLAAVRPRRAPDAFGSGRRGGARDRAGRRAGGDHGGGGGGLSSKYPV